MRHDKLQGHSQANLRTRLWASPHSAAESVGVLPRNRSWCFHRRNSVQGNGHRGISGSPSSGTMLQSGPDPGESCWPLLFPRAGGLCWMCWRRWSLGPPAAPGDNHWLHRREGGGHQHRSVPHWEPVSAVRSSAHMLCGFRGGRGAERQDCWVWTERRVPHWFGDFPSETSSPLSPLASVTAAQDSNVLLPAFYSHRSLVSLWNFENLSFSSCVPKFYDYLFWSEFSYSLPRILIASLHLWMYSLYFWETFWFRKNIFLLMLSLFCLSGTLLFFKCCSSYSSIYCSYFFLSHFPFLFLFFVFPEEILNFILSSFVLIFISFLPPYT